MSLIFNGIFTDTEIDEIKNWLNSGELSEKDLYITSSKRVGKELATIQLSTGKSIFFFPYESNIFDSLEEKAEYTPSELKTLFSRFFEEQYHYIPDFTVDIDAGIWLPVSIHFFEDDYHFEEELKLKDAKFKSFFKKFEKDMDKIKDKHDGGQFEYGDKVLQMMYGHYIKDYVVPDATSDDDVFTEEDDSTIIFSIDRGRNVIYLPTYKIDKNYTAQNKDKFLYTLINGKAEDLKNFVKKGFDLYTPLYEGMYSLHLAVKEKKYDKVQVLIEAGFEIDEKDENGYASVAYAIMNDDLVMIDYFNSYHADMIHVSEDDISFSLAKDEKTEKFLMKYL